MNVENRASDDVVAGGDVSAEGDVAGGDGSGREVHGSDAVAADDARCEQREEVVLKEAVERVEESAPPTTPFGESTDRAERRAGARVRRVLRKRAAVSGGSSLDGGDAEGTIADGGEAAGDVDRSSADRCSAEVAAGRGERTAARLPEAGVADSTRSGRIERPAIEPAVMRQRPVEESIANNPTSSQSPSSRDRDPSDDPNRTAARRQRLQRAVDRLGKARGRGETTRETSARPAAHSQNARSLTATANSEKASKFAEVAIDGDAARRSEEIMTASSSAPTDKTLSTEKAQGHALPAAEGLSWVIRERLDPSCCAAQPLVPVVRAEEGEAEEVEPRSLLYFDLETTGWIDRAQVFLAGYLFWEDGALVLVQEIASDVAEERFLMELAQRRMAQRRHWVSFNGASYDVPLLKRRLHYHRLPPLSADARHTDLLHVARRRYRRKLENCKLGTLETRVLGQERDGIDVPGSEAPLRFFDFVQSGKREFLEPIVYHNRIDLISLALLHQHLVT